MKKVNLNDVFLKVVTGGQYDVDVTLEGPTKEVLYRQVKTQFDSHQFVADVRFFFLIHFIVNKNDFFSYKRSLESMQPVSVMSFQPFHIN